MKDRNAREGQGLTEYALLLAFITLLFFVAYQNFGSTTTDMLQRVSQSVTTVS